jgi:maltose O-acetyltransferase
METSVSSERDKMLHGERYDAMDAELVQARARARALTGQFNHAPPERDDVRAQVLAALIGRLGERVRIEPPFHCDYGFNLELADDVYVNMNCIVLDCAPVRIGARALVGSGVQLLAATHSTDHAERRTGVEYALPITIGEDAWIGSGAIVCPGVSIGARSVIGAGSVVVRSIPADVVAAGNPCRVLR